MSKWAHSYGVTDAELKPRDEFDHYITPVGLAKEHLRRTLWQFSNRVNVKQVTLLDAGCGLGRYGTAFHINEMFSPPKAHRLYGIEINPKMFDLSVYPTVERGHQYYRHIFQADFLDDRIILPDNINIVIGNPPFKHAHEFVKRAYELVKPHYGAVSFLLPANYLASRSRIRDFQQGLSPHVVYHIPRPSFTGDGRTDAREYIIAYWDTTKPFNSDYTGHFLTWNFDSDHDFWGRI